MNEITYEGQTVEIGRTPQIVLACGFKGPAEVSRVASRHSSVPPHMQMDDVIDYFKNH